MAEPIRVLHVVGSLGVGGIQTYIMELYRHIDRSKVQFDFVVNIKTEQNYASEIKEMGGRVYYIEKDLFESKQWGQYIRFWKKFYKDHPEYHIVHGHLRSMAVIYLFEAKKAGLYTVAHSHSTNNGYGIMAKIKDFMQWPVRYIADFCMGCSQQANEWMFGKKKAKSETCIVLHNAIDIKKFIYSEEVRFTVRYNLEIGKATYVIGTVGRLTEQKNHQLLVSAMKEVIKTIPDSILLIIGDGPLKEKLEAQIKSLGLERKVRLLGSRNDVDKLINAFDVFCFPSLHEGLGISAVEAQANGLPVLISDAIPEEARITEQVKVVRDNWAKNIITTRGQPRKNVSDIMYSSGYDIREVSSWLEQFYLKQFSKVSGCIK